ncbi:MAG: hypothetical protein WBR18_07185, partial [Anaerolineales bacterium]
MRAKLPWLGWFSLGGLVSVLLLIGLYWLPPVHNRLEWRFDRAEGVIRGWLYPGDTLPTPVGSTGIHRPPTPLPPTPTAASPGPSV